MTPEKIRAILSGSNRSDWDALPPAEQQKLTRLVANNFGEHARSAEIIYVRPEIAWHARRGGVR